MSDCLNSKLAAISDTLLFCHFAPSVLLILFSLFILYNSGYMPVLKPIISTHLFSLSIFSSSLYDLLFHLSLLKRYIYIRNHMVGRLRTQDKQEKARMHSCFCFLIFFHKLPTVLTVLKSNLSSVVNIWKLKYFLSPANYLIKLTYVLRSSFRPSK